MKRFSATLMVVSMLAALLATGASAGAAPSPPNTAAERLDVYTGTLSIGQLDELAKLGIDRRELTLSAVGGQAAKGKVRVELILSGRQAAALRGAGVALAPKKVDGKTVAGRSASR